MTEKCVTEKRVKEKFATDNLSDNCSEDLSDDLEKPTARTLDSQLPNQLCLE